MSDRGCAVLDFSSANYLGLDRHPLLRKAITQAVSRWGTFTGAPRLLAREPFTARLEAEIAQLVRQDAALVFPSTTHIALDILPLLAGPQGLLFVDDRAYPTSLQGARLAAQRGACIVRFPHNNHQCLANLLRRHAAVSGKVIVCDGLYPADGHTACLAEFKLLAKKFCATIYMDDAHGIGLLGSQPNRQMPYGHGGGGTSQYLNVGPGHVLTVGSLSKAFSVPVAFVAGPRQLLAQIRREADTFIHSSPPSIPDLAAAVAALQVHESQGYELRSRLLKRVRCFRQGLGESGVRLSSTALFPVQTIHLKCPKTAMSAWQDLRRMGISTLLQLQPPERPTGGALRFVIAVRHTKADIDSAISIVTDKWQFLTHKNVA